MNQESPIDYDDLLRRALAEIEALEARLRKVDAGRSEPIAVVGIGCRFPAGGDDPEAFWASLRDGIDGVTEVPPERWDVDATYDPDPDAPGKSYTRWGAFVPDVDKFDPAFFGVSPREAISMDPQQRLLLEVTWEALENAAIPPSSLSGSQTAVYVGITTHDYAIELAEAVGSRNGDAYTPSGTAHSVAAGRISYVLGLHGPNVAIDTACSSSLVAMHWAIHSLRNRESDLALAGGVNLTLIADGAVLTSRARMMSFDGHCKTFDASADGYVRGEGCGMLVLKRLSDAQRHGDRVLAVVRGSALNQDGRSSGLTAPNGRAQEAVIRAALSSAGLGPADVDYVEAHGTGTPLGDPIEVKALNAVYGQRPAASPLIIGSVKTNIGHLEAAAGIAGVVKTVLAMQHDAIPPHLHLREPNPLIEWDRYPIRVAKTLTPWLRVPGRPRRAGVSSFGFSGTNAHVILEEAPDGRPCVPEPGGPQLVVLSAQTPAALTELAAHLCARLDGPDAPTLPQLAATLALGRSALAERAAFAAVDAADARGQIAALAAGNPPSTVARARATGAGAPEVVFMFTGQGAQQVGMTRGLYDAEPVFRAALDECERLLEGELPRPLLEVMFGDASALDDTAYTQPALFSVGWALSRLWRHRGVEPTVVLGHSVGEYVAACVAGVFSLEDALALIAARGRAMSALPRNGGMAAVFADEVRVRDALIGHAAAVSIAATNGPESTVLSGRIDALDAVLARLAVAGVEFQRLTVSHAFHSPLMEPMLDAFERRVAATPMSPPSIGLLSNLSGRLAGDEILTPGYWRRHVREPVRFAESIATLQQEGFRIFVELGPSPTLIGMGQRCATAPGIAWIASLRKGREDRIAMLDAAAQLHVRGQSLDWATVLGEGAAGRRVVLPTYPFQRNSYWHDLSGARSRAALTPLRTSHPLLEGRMPTALPIWEGEVGIGRHSWLRDHRIFDFTLFPGTGFLELATAVAGEVLGTTEVEVRDLVLREAMALPDDGALQVQVIAIPRVAGGHDLAIHGRRAGPGGDDRPWRVHATCTVGHAGATNIAGRPRLVPQAAVEALPDELDVEDYYTRLDRQGAHYGPAFRSLSRIRRKGGDVLGRVSLPEPLAATAGNMRLHPALLDACFQLVGAGLPWSDDEAGSGDDLCVPTGIGRYQLHRSGVSAGWCRASVTPDADDSGLFRAGLQLFDDEGVCVAEITGLELRRTTRAALLRVLGAGSPRDWLYETRWFEHPIALPVAATTVEADTWLVLTDAAGVGSRLASLLRERGAQVFEATSGPTTQLDGMHWTLDESDAEQWRAVFAEAERRAGRPVSGVVSLRALDAVVSDGADIAAIEAAQRPLLAATLALAQALGDSRSRLWYVTRGSQAAGGVSPDLAQAPAWGLAGVVASELPGLRCVRVDLDIAGGESDALRLLDELLEPDGEDRVAYRGANRLAARLSPGSAEPRLPESPLRLEITQRGTLDNLKLLPFVREAPGPGQVEIRVHATGLNFRDVLNALGMYPGDPGPLGNECAGVVTATGDGVEHLAVGDEVVAMVDRSFATWVVAPAALTVRKPAAMSFAAAATVPVTFLTARYALHDLARIRRGDRVLIHAVTGGVGMAALQLALRAGAEVYGTAGTPAKRALARRLGVHHVGDSRALSFAAAFRDASGGEGVDIVLNSLAGDFIPASLGLLRPGGRFVEIGKTGIWESATVADAYPGVEYHPLYLGEVAAARPRHVSAMLEEILADIERGELSALPMRCYPLDEAEAAFRFMGQGHHTGKVVIVQWPAPHIRPDGRYLVTGGLGGLGLVFARALADAGARHLTLVGRRQPSEAATATIEAIRARGVSVEVASADVADGDSMAALLRAAPGRPAVRGILHAAGVLDDAPLAELDPARFEPVMAPKVRGTWHLHELSQRATVDFFVTFSSGAALLGSPGQGNYAAANAFMDGLASRRRSAGLHALSIAWGSWAGAGMAAGVGSSHRRRWAATGLSMIEPEDGVQMLWTLLNANRHAHAAALPLDRGLLPAGLGPFFSLLRSDRNLDAPTDPVGDGATDVLPRLAAAPAAERSGLLTAFLADQVVKVLALGASTAVDTQRSLMDLGMDSLMAMELRNRVEKAIGIRLAVADLLKGPTIAELAFDVTGRLADAMPDASSTVSTTDELHAWEEGTL